MLDLLLRKDTRGPPVRWKIDFEKRLFINMFPAFKEYGKLLMLYLGKKTKNILYMYI